MRAHEVAEMLAAGVLMGALAAIIAVGRLCHAQRVLGPMLVRAKHSALRALERPAADADDVVKLRK